MKKLVLLYFGAFLGIFIFLNMQPVNAQNKGELVSEDKSVTQAYADLLQSEANIKAEIESINSMLPSLGSLKSRKATKRLLELESMYESIQRQKAYYPSAATSTEPKKRVEDSARDDVHKVIEEKVQARGGTMEIDESIPEADTPQYWSIVLAMSSNPDRSKYLSYGDVEVELMGDKYVFFLGKYTDKSEADARCKQILKKGKLRNVFVTKR